MKHILINEDGQVHASIIGCPFKYTVPRGLKVLEDNPVMGRVAVDHYQYDNPKRHDNNEADAMDFAVVKDGIIQNVIVWGGAEWMPPFGTTLVPLAQWIGSGDYYDEASHKFTIHENRLGKKDSNKTVSELLDDATNSM